eukprot:GDKJ01048917.1.p1 GENE.GDKJ01048917.1~~GDKJ01048917.1.p1  ORF type:complete len:713 (-),score=113.33 GDKJ01048917.1:94-2232(-)
MKALFTFAGLLIVDSNSSVASRRLKQKKAKDLYEIPVLPITNGIMMESVYGNPLPEETAPGYTFQAVTKRTPVSYICPSGFVRVSGDYCDQVNTKLATRICPFGIKMKDGMCLGAEQMRPEYYCPSGQILQGGSCIRETRSEAEILCPTGFILSGSYCTKLFYSDVQSYCEVGWIFEKNVCVRTVEVDSRFTCPEGYERVPLSSNYSQIFPKKGFPASRSSKSLDANLTGFTCEKLFPVPLIENCPPKNKWACPDGYKLDYNEGGSAQVCIREERIPAHEDCFDMPQTEKKGSGGTPSKACEPVCPPEAIRAEKGVCVMLQTANPINMCLMECPSQQRMSAHPSSQNSKKGDCFDVEIADPIVECPSDDYRLSPVLGYQSKSTILLKGSSSKEGPVSSAEQTLNYVGMKGGLYAPSTGENVVGYKCFLEEHRTPTQGCDVLQYPDAIMTADSARMGKCVSDIQVLAQSSCPPLSLPSSGKYCIHSHASPALPFCPEGFTVKLQGEICHRDIAVPPEWVCPLGFELQAIDVHVQEIHPLDPPSGTKDTKKTPCANKDDPLSGDHHCTSPQPPALPQAVLHETATCIQVLSAPTLPVCPKGYTLVQGNEPFCEQTDILANLEEPTEVLAETPEQPEPIEPVVLVQYVQPPAPEPIVQYQQIVVQATTPKPCKHKKCKPDLVVTTPPPIVAAYPIIPQDKKDFSKKDHESDSKKY